MTELICLVDVRNTVLKVLPEVEVELAKPAFSNGFWHANFKHKDKTICLRIESPIKFGVTLLPSDHGNGADCYLDSPVNTADKIVKLLS